MAKLTVRRYIDVEISVPDELKFQANYVLGAKALGFPVTRSFCDMAEQLKNFGMEHANPRSISDFGFSVESVTLSDEDRSTCLYKEGEIK